MTTTTHAPATATAAAPRVSTAVTRTGWAVTAVVSLLLLLDSAAKLARLQPVRDSFADLGWPDHLIVPVGLLLLGCVVLHLVPRTSIVGAALLTAYLGGAVATHVRVEGPLFSTVLTPVYVAIAVWVGLYLRDARVRALIAAR